MYTLNGITVSEGVGAGPALIMNKAVSFDSQDEDKVFDSESEIAKFKKASNEFSTRLYQVTSGPAPDSVRDLFGAAAGFITNAKNVDAIISLILSGASAAKAAKIILFESLKAFEHSSDPELKAQERELKALAKEFISTLVQSDTGSFEVPTLTVPSVIVASDLTPARFLCLRTDLVSAVILEGGLSSGHLGTVLRELHIPSIFSVIGATGIKNGEQVLVDANNGVVMVEPPSDTAFELLHENNPIHDDLEDDSLLNITVAPSIGATRELNLSPSLASHGLGLLRSEFLFLGNPKEPTEDEMIEIFAPLFDKFPKDKPLSARTFDFAGDKKPIFAVKTDDKGPLLGYGANVGTELLKTEIRALLRAAVDRKLTLIFPLVTRVSEVKYLNDLCAMCIDELNEEELPHGDVSTALMIETPAAVLSASAFAKMSSRFFIGTSSLAQYASAPRVPDVSFTPALAKMIAMACHAAAQAGVPAAMAGRFAARVDLLPFFLNLGVNYITVDSYSIPKVRSAIERLDLNSANDNFSPKLYEQIMELASGRELADLINNLNFTV